MAETPQSILQAKLTDIHRQAEERDAERRAKDRKTPYVDVRKLPVSIDAVKFISEEDARKAYIAAVQMGTSELAVIVYDPLLEETKKVIGELEKKNYHAKMFVVSKSGLAQVWRMYEFIPPEAKEITGKVEITKKRLEELLAKLTTIETVKKEIEGFDFGHLSTTNLIEAILAGAMANRTSDIHFEAEEKTARIRFRIDGLLHDVVSALPAKNYESLVSRVKLFSGLKINIHGEAQDGRFTIKLENKEIEMRVSIIPSEFGETVVMRILDPAAIMTDLEHLGLRADDLALVDEELRRPNGLILNTGPTGSGKTTTLYAFLRKLVNPETKIITIEDPIEYRVAGVEQTQTNTEVGYTFADGLRAIVRQDPDVILVGEIRDFETANIALQASLTGHMVFSTLHTNSAVGAVPRLVDLGVKAESIGPALSLIIAQRLVRVLCENCKKAVPTPSDLKKKIESFFEKLPSRVDRAPYETIKMFFPVGCEKCNMLGYKGRRGIFEFLRCGTEFQELVLSSSSEVGLRKFAKKQEMVSMQEDGVLKTLLGITTFEEVESVTGPIVWEEKA
ncbi:MAG: GspE/PulE family protein [Patescibacteria group bacterium]